MPAIFSAEKIKKVWELSQQDKSRTAIAISLNISLEDIDAYIFAAYKKFYIPKLQYKNSDPPSLFISEVTDSKKFERPKAVYSNINWQEKYT